MEHGRRLAFGLTVALVATLSSCQEALNVEVINNYSAAVTVSSNDTTVTVQPASAAVVPFPSKENGSLIRIAVAEQWRCYTLDAPGFRIDDLPTDTHGPVRSRLDAALRLHFRNATGETPEQVLEGVSCSRR